MHASFDYKLTTALALTSVLLCEIRQLVVCIFMKLFLMIICLPDPNEDLESMQT